MKKQPKKPPVKVAEFKPLEHIYQDLPGWFDFSEIYDEAIKTAGNGDTLVETGTWEGKSACYMAVEAHNSRKDLKLFTVDNEADLVKVERIEKRLKKYKNLTFLNMDSIEASRKFADGSVNMVFLDSDHHGDFVYDEMAAWLPKLKRGGMFCGHDFHSGFPGLVSSVLRFAKEKGYRVRPWGSSWQMIIE